jgi:hypothetical protein
LAEPAPDIPAALRRLMVCGAFLGVSGRDS